MKKIISGWERMGILRIDVSQEYEAPWGYGLAYWRWDCAKAVCYPLGINWIVWIFREIWLRLKSTPRGIEAKSYNVGLEEGFNTGFSSGYRQGRWDEKHEPKGVVYKNNGNDVWLKSDE